ncbi:MAG: nucleotidyl transferase AbiEii/AbiGii toxin family protein [Acidobacteria bacterium]|nr:nucleotidyl transferase AbiEii/AbiGii toxin family protein [Acidobacteriota bacterium]
MDTYYLKGGVAMELRFAQRARATKDVDLGIEGTRATRLQKLSGALGLGFDEFTFRVKARVRHMDQADTVRVQVAIQYRTRSWQTVEVDLGPATMGQVDLIEPRVQGLVELGIPVTSPVRCLGIADQVAQKLHACTGPSATGRARDVLDILLIDALGQINYAETTNTARRVFEERATHVFPPEFVMPQEWRPELEALAADLDFPLKTSAAIERRFLEELAAARCRPKR